MHIIMLNAVPGHAGEPAKVHELRLDSRAQDDSATNLIDLVAVDARGMDAAALNASILWVARLRNSQSVRKAIMICRKPPIEFVVRAIRAGINDVFERPLTGRQVYQLLARHTRDQAARRAARAIMQCGNLFATTEAQQHSIDTGERERRVEELQKQVAAESARLEKMRETMQIRETELLTRARRLDEEFARLQGDVDLKKAKSGAPAPAEDGAIPPGNTPEHERLRRAEIQLKARATDLDRRETALATRDRMLREFEAMLLSQSPATPR